MKLILVTEYFHPANNAPGARFKPLVDKLSEHSFDVTIYTSKISRNVTEYNVVWNWIKFPSNQKSTLIRLFFELAYGCETFFRLLFSSGDIYYLTSPSFINCVLARFYCRLFGKRYVVDIRDDYPRVYFDTGLISRQSWIGKILSGLERGLYTKADLVIAATGGLKANIEKITDRSVWLLRNGFSEKLFYPSVEKDATFTLVFHGIISKFQDIDLLIQLGKSIHEQNLPFHIIVIGQGNQDYKLKNDIPPVISYLGQKSYAEIPKLISRAHIGLSFRKKGKISEDSFPVKTYEYLGVGIPIIVTPVSEAGEYVSANDLGYQFDPADIKGILNTITQLANDPGLYAGIVENIKKVRNQFSREKMSDILAAELRSMASKP